MLDLQHKPYYLP